MRSHGVTARLAALGASLALLGGCAGAATPSLAPAPSGVTPSAVPSASHGDEPSPTPGATLAAEPAWQRVADQEVFADAQMLAVAGGPAGYVAVGATRTDDAMAGAVWISPDGMTWRRASLASVDDVLIDGAIHDRLGYVIWGTSSQAATCPRDAEGGRSCAAIWISPDAETWSRAPYIPSFRGVDIVGVARLGDDLVAVSDDLRAWASLDGLAWRPLGDVDPAGWGGYISGVAAADGALVAWGHGPVAAGDVYPPVSLRTVDGRSWVIGGAGLDTQGTLIASIRDVIAADGRLVGVGNGLQGEAGSPPPPSGAWISTDGLTWTRGEFTPSPSIGQLSHAVWHGGRYVALGWVSPATIERLSVDGRTWTEGASAPDTEVDGNEGGGGCTGGPCPRSLVSDLAAGPAGLVAVGETRPVSGGLRAIVWFARAAGD